MKKYLFLFLIFLATPAFAGFESVIQYYNAAGGGEPVSYPDPDADWKMDSGALTTDSSGNGNTLTDAISGTDLDTSVYVEGTAAALFDATDDKLVIADASLSAGFWGKSDGGSLSGTICSAFNSASVETDGVIIAKYHAGNNLRTYRIIVDSATTSVEFWIGVLFETNNVGISNITQGSQQEHATDIAINHWYATCVSLDSDGTDYRIRLYDCGTDNNPESCSHTGTDATGTFALPMQILGAELNIGNNSDESTDFFGRIDRTTVWSSELSTGEMDAWAAELGI